MNIFGESLIPEEAKYFIVVYSEEGKVLECSATALEVLGYSREELLAMTAFDIGVGTTPERYQKTWNIAKEMQFSPIISDAKLRTKTGDIVEARVKFIFSSTGKQPCAIVIGEVLRRHDKENLEILSGSMHTIQIEDLIAQVNAKGNFIYGSKKFLDMLGYDTEEFIGTSITDICTIDEGNMAKKNMELPALFAYHKPVYIKEMGFKTKKGHILNLNVHLTPTFSDNNRFKGYKFVYDTLISSSVEKNVGN
jgi:PAS domain S-box-containing protein